MPDREKVKKGFERCLSGKMPFGCGECPYFGDEEYNDAWSCRLSLMRDAFALLKEQEERIEQLNRVVNGEYEQKTAGTNKIPLKW